MSKNPFNHSNLIMILFGAGSAAIAWFALSFFGAKSEIAVMQESLKNNGIVVNSVKDEMQSLTKDLVLAQSLLARLEESNSIIKKRVGLAHNQTRQPVYAVEVPVIEKPVQVQTEHDQTGAVEYRTIAFRVDVEKNLSWITPSGQVVVIREVDGKYFSEVRD